MANLRQYAFKEYLTNLRYETVINIKNDNQFIYEILIESCSELKLQAGWFPL